MSEEASFVHVLLTRFNALVDYARVPGARLTSSWLRSRFGPFDRFCYPSVRVQSASFHWLVFFDAETPEVFKEEIVQYEAFTPVFVEGILSDRRIAEAVRTHVNLDSTHLITTRLDSDDAIGDEYLAVIQAQFKGQERQFINMPLGYEWDDGGLYYRIDMSNAFMSLIERLPAPDATPRTVHCAPHDQLRSTGEVRQVWTRPMWLVTIHGSNNEGERLGIRRINGALPEEFVRQMHLPLEAASLPARVGDFCRSTARLAGLSAKRGGRILLRPLISR